MSTTGIWAVVPVKNFERAKTRLAGSLPPTRRRQFCRAMLCDTLKALRDAPSLGGIVVVTNDPDAIDIARSYGADVLNDPNESGPSAAVSLGAQWLAKIESCTGMFAVMADTPLVTADELQSVLTNHGPAPAVTLIPARDGIGTNAAICSPTNVIALCFDGKSFPLHRKLAKMRGAEVNIVRMASFGLDIDTAEDLSAFLATPSNTLAAKELAADADVLTEISA
ncbi:MAG: 2-phospho-L-lactate guanylyltransferase [Rhodospirillaceae bacterium]|jgi:2-phospho-L-lactate/phosphoenolpyruvate guanylyltransferase|nr:2-phospho-L-lactate guanylyltransferase [Rhodospirillaceae bacterium]